MTAKTTSSPPSPSRGIFDSSPSTYSQARVALASDPTLKGLEISALDPRVVSLGEDKVEKVLKSLKDRRAEMSSLPLILKFFLSFPELRDLQKVREKYSEAAEKFIFQEEPELRYLAAAYETYEELLNWEDPKPSEKGVKKVSRKKKEKTFENKGEKKLLTMIKLLSKSVANLSGRDNEKNEALLKDNRNRLNAEFLLTFLLIYTLRENQVKQMAKWKVVQNVLGEMKGTTNLAHYLDKLGVTRQLSLIFLICIVKSSSSSKKGYSPAPLAYLISLISLPMKGEFEEWLSALYALYSKPLFFLEPIISLIRETLSATGKLPLDESGDYSSEDLIPYIRGIWRSIKESYPDKKALESMAASSSKIVDFLENAKMPPSEKSD